MHHKNPGFALPFCLVMLAVFLPILMYHWQEITLLTDLVHQRATYRQNRDQAERLFTQALNHIQTQFDSIQQKVPHTFVIQDDQQGHTQVSVNKFINESTTLCVAINFIRHQERLITITCLVKRLQTLKDTHDFKINYVTISNPV